MMTRFFSFFVFVSFCLLIINQKEREEKIVNYKVQKLLLFPKELHALSKMSHANIKITGVNFIKLFIMTGMMDVPPHQKCLGPAPGPPPDLRCLLMMLVMKIGTIWALGVPPPSEVSWACIYSHRCLGGRWARACSWSSVIPG